jgi:hypothetical protein
MDMEGYKVQPPHHSLERITCLAFSPDNVHETGVSPGGRSGSSIVGAEVEQVERTRKKDLVTRRIGRLCALQAQAVARSAEGRRVTPVR